MQGQLKERGRGLASKNRTVFWGGKGLCLLTVRCLGKRGRVEIGFLLISVLVFTTATRKFFNNFLRIVCGCYSSLSFRHACLDDGDASEA